MALFLLEKENTRKMNNFWIFFSEIKKILGIRAKTFETIFNYLDTLNKPITIIETGCIRNNGTWAQEGQSTILFDKYAESHPGTIVITVDLDPKATSLCRTLVSERVFIHTGDSVAFFKSLSDGMILNIPSIDLLYLDSYDVDFDAPHLSALHHLKELIAIAPLLNHKTLVVTDDSPTLLNYCNDEQGNIIATSNPKIAGKGLYVAEYAKQIGAQILFTNYQAGWIGIGKTKRD